MTLNKMEKYRKKLIEAGFLEPSVHKQTNDSMKFYKQCTDVTAFIVNIHNIEENIEIVYGFASIAFTLLKGDKLFLVENGLDDTDITLREKVILDEKVDVSCIQKLYQQYKNIHKEELLKIANKKRKMFIKEFDLRLKPLGMIKKGNSWIKNIDDTYYVMFNIQKSMYSDSYYFNEYIGKQGTNQYGDCYYIRTNPSCEESPLDWQLISHEKLLEYIEKDVVEFVSKVLHTPLFELGKSRIIQSGCECDRKQCDECWLGSVNVEFLENKCKCGTVIKDYYDLADIYYTNEKYDVSKLVEWNQWLINQQQYNVNDRFDLLHYLITNTKASSFDKEEFIFGLYNDLKKYFRELKEELLKSRR